MTSIITRSDLIASIQNTVENDDVRVAAIMAVNRLYINEHTANIPDDNESAFFNVITHYNDLHEYDPQRYNQHTIEEEAHALFF